MTRDKWQGRTAGGALLDLLDLRMRTSTRLVIHHVLRVYRGLRGRRSLRTRRRVLQLRRAPVLSGVDGPLRRRTHHSRRRLVERIPIPRKTPSPKPKPLIARGRASPRVPREVAVGPHRRGRKPADLVIGTADRAQIEMTSQERRVRSRMVVLALRARTPAEAQRHRRAT
jgi:hypothetical protein